ncbi:TetR/AcrR family transcriptional regulator [Phycicoccus sp. 3266]|uniref:TetR/AcrR family transcriptional regulator n=1 Tax=Phycicoccus sp. 3266 TaxID=2817751 RepID=UPI00285A26B1|nr:TetR/AcrR family transcriptional regulator [Phycicoccus sp. 3266]MDR6863614.1 AcrR family transcriptional regulator [Phycicoccus sp. 3266]
MTRARPMTPDARRAAIVTATLPLLREKGRAVSTREIAKAAGVAEGTLFRAFDNKDEIITACVHEAFDNAGLLADLAAVDRGLPLRDRLAVAVGVMQDHLKGIFTMMSVLQATGQPLAHPTGADAVRRRREATAELDAAFVDLVGADVEDLRIPARDFLAYLRMLTLSSVHPMLDGTNAAPEALVGVLLDGALADTATPSTRGKK